MKRQPRITKREKKALAPRAAAPQGGGHHDHIHCVSCGKHLNESEFDATPPTAQWTKCLHGSSFPTCTEHLETTKGLLAEHDRTGEPVRSAAMWH